MTRTQIKYWLTGTGLGLIALHLNQSYRYGKPGFFSHSGLFWLVVLLILWEKRTSLKLESDRLSGFIGTALLSLILYRSLHLFPEDFWLRISPLLSLLCWCAIASGIKNLKQYGKELFLLSFLAIPWELLYLFDLSQLTAKFSTFMLWVLGFEVTRQSVWIIMPTGSVEVYNGCSGVRTILQLLGLSWILLALIATSWQQKLSLTTAAIAIGFVINGARVALMAVLVALSNMDDFNYWHTGDGSLIFSAISVTLFAAICLAILPMRNLEIWQEQS